MYIYIYIYTPHLRSQCLSQATAFPAHELELPAPVVCCSVLERVAVCCSVLRCVAVLIM